MDAKIERQTKKKERRWKCRTRDVDRTEVRDKRKNSERVREEQKQGPS